MVTKLEERLAAQKSIRRKRVWVVVTVLCLLASVAWAASYVWFGGKVEKPRQIVKRGEEAEHFIMPPNKLNILILGVDDRPKEDDPGRSDTMIIMTLDTVSREASIISVPRDTRVRVKGLGFDKVNHAFLIGGVALSRETAENFLGIPVDYFAKVNLDSFGRIIDAVGGVTVNVEKRMQYVDSWDGYTIDLQPGVQRLDGRTALQYVRYRDEDGDIGRVARQQGFIKALLVEVNTPGIILKAPSIIREVFASLDTDMPMAMMMGLARKLKDGMNSGMKTFTVPGLPYYIDDLNYWVPDVMATREMVAQMQGVAFEGRVKDAARRLADEHARNFPANAHLDDGTYYPGMDKDKKDKGKLPVKPGDKSVKPGDKSPVKPGATSGPVRLAVEIINASGSSDAGGKVSGMMSSRGFEVVSVGTASAPVKTTVVTAYTQNPSLVSKLTGLPFKYVLNIQEDSSRKVLVRIIIGQDYGGR